MPNPPCLMRNHFPYKDFARFAREIFPSLIGTAFMGFVTTAGAIPPTQTIQLFASDGAAREEFGNAVALSNLAGLAGAQANVAIVGAEYDSIGTGSDAAERGSANIFILNSSGVWVWEAKLTASDGKALDHFGFSVAIFGNTAVIGAPDDDGSFVDQGSAYIFQRSSTGAWTQVAKLLASDAAIYDYFGFSVAISNTVVATSNFGDVVAVGAPYKDITTSSVLYPEQGAAYFFKRATAGTWSQEARVLGTNSGASDSPSNDHFGWAVSQYGTRGLVSAPLDDINGVVNEGSVYTFTRASSGVWGLEAKMFANATQRSAGDEFGYSVSLFDNQFIAGSPFDDFGVDPNVVVNQGSAYIFQLSGAATWTQEAKIFAATGIAYSNFGVAVGLQGNLAVVTSPYDDTTAQGGAATFTDLGSAYRFTQVTPSTWGAQSKFTCLVGQPGLNFGMSASVYGEETFIGAKLADVGSPLKVDQGTAYIFDLTPLDCNNNDNPDPDDIAQGISKDCNLNGIPDSCDIAAGTPDVNDNGIPDTCEISPTDVAATDGTLTTGVDVTWATFEGATGYKIFRALGTTGAAAQIGTVGAVLTYSDTTAVAGTLYTYSVKANTPAGLTGISAGDTGWRNIAAPLSVAATDGTLTTGVTVTWAAVSGATGYQVWRALGDGVAAQIANLGVVLTYSDTTAVAGTSYTYTVKSKTSSGVSAASIGNTGYRNLTAPLSVAATDGTLTTGVTVTWAASTGATGYQVWRAIGTGAAAQIETVGAVLTYSDNSAIAGTLYTYTVKATGAVGVSAASTGNTGYRSLIAPMSVAATDGTLTTGVTVTWAASSGATGYQVWRAIGAGVAAQIATVGAVVTYSDTTAVAGTLYTYSVKAVAAAGVSAASATDTGYRNLTAPLSVAATDGTLTTGVTVTWAASTGATGYKIYRDGSESALATVGAVLTYSDVSAVPGISYAYTVKATGAVGISVASLSNTGYRNLTAPLSVTATDGTSTSEVTVTWAASTGATGYQVWRAIGTGVAAQIATVGAVLTYSDTTAIAGTLYTYTVKATGAVGVSAASTGNTGYRSLIAPMSVAATDGTLTTGVTVTWAASTGATGYQVWRAIGAGVAAQIGTVGAVLTYSDTTAVAGILYTYSVKAVAAAGATAASATDTGYRNLTAPLSVAATDGTLTTGVTVTWAASTGATGYQVWRAIGAGVAEQITTVGAVLTYSDTTAIAGTSYTYTVKATGAVGVSAASLGNTGYRNLTAPLSVAATDGTSTSEVTVTWAASTSATGYQVWRAIGAGVAAQIGTVGAVVTYSDTTAIAGTLYTYTVKATGAVGVSAASTGNTGYRNRVGPATVTATDTDLTKVHVTWTAITGTPAATGYEVWRTIGDTAAVLLATTAPTTLFFDDTTIAQGVTALYSVKAKYVLVGSSPATTVTTLPTSDVGIRPVGATGGGDDGGIAGGPESSTALPGGSGNKGDESENAAGSGDSQNAATDPADDGTENPQGEVKPEVKPEEKPDECMTIALALADQIDALENELKQSVKDESATAITQKLLDRMRMLMEPAIDNERAVCAMARGDVTLDGVIDNDDLGAFLESWSAGDLIGADLNRDGRITAADMAIVLSAIDAASGNGNGNPKTE